MVRSALAAMLVALPLLAGEPSPIEDRSFLPESGWNRGDGAVQYNTFFLGRTSALELAQEWGSPSARHQFSYTLPVFDDGATGLGDATLNYRFQLLGKEGSRFAVAPRATLLLPTRSDHFGGPASGVQVNVPLSVALGARVTTHTSVGATWFRDGGGRELAAAQSIAFEIASGLSLSLDAAWKKCGDGELLVARPGLQYTIETARGLVIAPGIAVPIAPGSAGVMFFVALEQPLGAGRN